MLIPLSLLWVVSRASSGDVCLLYAPAGGVKPAEVSPILSKSAGRLSGCVVQVETRLGSFSEVAKRSDPWAEGDLPTLAPLTGRNFLDLGWSDDVDLFDDASWRELETRVSLAGKLCRTAHMEGLYFRLAPEKFTRWAQLDWGDHKLMETKQQAHLRGREVGERLSSAAPGLTLIVPSYPGKIIRAFDAAGMPAVREGAGDLLADFVGGLLAGLDQSARLVLGTESQTIDDAGKLAAPDLQDRWRSQVFQGGELGLIPEGAPYAWTATEGPPPHAATDRALEVAAPLRTSRLERILDAGPNRVVNGGIVGSLGWDRDIAEDGVAELDHSRFSGRGGSLRLSGARVGAWVQDIPVEGGESLALRASAESVGAASASLEVRWKGGDGRELSRQTWLAFVPTDNSKSGWQLLMGGVRAPIEARTLCLRLTMLGAGRPSDAVWFRDVRAVSF